MDSGGTNRATEGLTSTGSLTAPCLLDPSPLVDQAPEPASAPSDGGTQTVHTPSCHLAVVLAALTGLALMIDGLWRSSATYDEVAYLRIAALWWRTGEQDEITRMGSPLTFWKLQQAPVLWALDRLGYGEIIDDPIGHQRVLLPLARLGSLWIWLAALLVTAVWSRCLYGPRAMAFAAWLFALSPNLLAHGGLATMELPLVACTAGMFFLFWRFLATSDRCAFWACAALGGLAWSCKFTTVLIPPLLALGWWAEGRRRNGGRSRNDGPSATPGAASLSLKTRADQNPPLPSGGEGRGEGDDGPEACVPQPTLFHITSRMLAFVAVLAATNFVVTGFATLPLSGRMGQPHPTLDGAFSLRPLLTRLIETPLPQDWVGFATQMRHQRSGGPSYLFGERRMTGWRHYYFVALAVKTPLSLWLLIAARAWFSRWSRNLPGPHDMGWLGSRASAVGLLSRSPLVGEGRGGGSMSERAPHPPPSPPPQVGREKTDSQRVISQAIPYERSKIGERLILVAIAAFLAITALGSSRNYGFRYLLPLAPLAIVWISALAEGGRWARRLAWLGLVGQAIAVASIHPHELTYFNTLAGGPIGGRRILADSNLDWGQGAKSLARLQGQHPEFRDVTLYYFGDTDPGYYGVVGPRYVIDAGEKQPGLPPRLGATTRYVAVSASLQYGPWGPPGYFRPLRGLKPVAYTDETTIAVYRTSDVTRERSGFRLNSRERHAE